VFCIDRGGLVGAEAPHTMGFFEYGPFMRNIPNMIVTAPMDEIELRNLMYTAQLEKIKSPFSIRYPRGCGVFTDWKKPFQEIESGKPGQISEGNELAILSIGSPGNIVASVVRKFIRENMFIAHYDMRFVTPLDKNVLHSVFTNFTHIITVEDGILREDSEAQ